MKAVKLGKMLKPSLPSRQAMQALGKTDRSIADYAKATPLMQSDVEPASILQSMWKPLDAG